MVNIFEKFAMTFLRYYCKILKVGLRKVTTKIRIVDFLAEIQTRGFSERKLETIR